VEIKNKFTPDSQIKLIDKVRQVLRYHHYSMSTEKTYCDCNQPLYGPSLTESFYVLIPSGHGVVPKILRNFTVMLEIQNSFSLSMLQVLLQPRLPCIAIQAGLPAVKKTELSHRMTQDK
jgi:hypothetical protein